MSRRLCPPPKVGDKLVTGYQCFGSLVIGEVVAVYDQPDEWGALVLTDRRAHFEAVDHVAVRVGLWRSWERRDEHPKDSDAEQARQRAAWEAL